MSTETLPRPTTRGTSNSNQRGSSYSRRSRRAFLVTTYAADVPGCCRCYRCGVLMVNPDNVPPGLEHLPLLTVDRILPGVRGGTYLRNNIRPACGPCNSSTGGKLATRGDKK